MDSKVFGYARVSTKEQNLDRQLIALAEQGIEERNIIVDKESGKDLERKGYQLLKGGLLRRGDTLIIKSLDRLSRNKCDIKHELEYFKDNGIRLKVIDLPTTMIDFPDGQEWVMEMVNNILIEVLGTIAEQERANIKQRQAEGIAAAKVKGVELGRPKAQKPPNWEEVIGQWKAGEITATKAMELTGTKRTTFYKLLGAQDRATHKGHNSGPCALSCRRIPADHRRRRKRSFPPSFGCGREIRRKSLGQQRTRVKSRNTPPGGLGSRQGAAHGLGRVLPQTQEKRPLKGLRIPDRRIRWIVRK